MSETAVFGRFAHRSCQRLTSSQACSAGNRLAHEAGTQNSVPSADAGAWISWNAATSKPTSSNSRIHDEISMLNSMPPGSSAACGPVEATEAEVVTLERRDRPARHRRRAVHTIASGWLPRNTSRPPGRSSRWASADPHVRVAPDRGAVLADREVERAIGLSRRSRRCRAPIRCRRRRARRRAGVRSRVAPTSCRSRTPTRRVGASTPTRSRFRSRVRSPAGPQGRRAATAAPCSGCPRSPTWVRPAPTPAHRKPPIGEHRHPSGAGSRRRGRADRAKSRSRRSPYRTTPEPSGWVHLAAPDVACSIRIATDGSLLHRQASAGQSGGEDHARGHLAWQCQSLRISRHRRDRLRTRRPRPRRRSRPRRGRAWLATRRRVRRSLRRSGSPVSEDRTRCSRRAASIHPR